LTALRPHALTRPEGFMPIDDQANAHVVPLSFILLAF